MAYRKTGLCLILLLSLFVTCKKDQPVSYLADHRYPAPVRDIMLLKCATSGCHNTQSKDAASGLDLSSWDKLFQGGRNGSSVVPFRPDFSFLPAFCNTYSDLGQTLLPTMPLNQTPLSREEMTVLTDWIKAGAPDADGYVKFSENTHRKKMYVVNQGCDLVSVYDAETRLLMRVVDVGALAGVSESPHDLRFSSDQKYWYLVFYNGTILQRFNAVDDSPAGQVEIGPGSWNTMTISSDNKRAYCVNWSANGSVAVVDLENMSLLAQWRSASNLFTYPHGSAFAGNNDTLYLTAQQGNFIYKVPIDDPSSPILVSLQPGIPPSITSSLDIHELTFTPDYAFYLLSCQKSNEVRMMQTSNDSLVAVFPVGDYPQELNTSSTSDYVFVTCMEDTTHNTIGRGSVAIINYKTKSLVKIVHTGFQPHGLVIDEEKQLVYVANRNITKGGPAPHHSSVCAGKNGYVTAIDMNTLELTSFKAETFVDPFCVGIRYH